MKENYQTSKQLVKQLTQEEAVKFAKAGSWKDFTTPALFVFQILQKKLCTDFSVFHEAAELTLGRAVFTHEFAKPELLWDEYRGLRTTSTDPFSTWNEVTV